MATKAKNTAVATVTTTGISVPRNSSEVPAAIEALKVQLEALKGNVDERISLDINYNGRNIKSVDTIGELLQMSASLHARATAYEAEIKRYQLEKANIKGFEEDGKSVVHWEKVISKAINELMNKVQIDRLESAIKKLSQHVDAETKLQNDLAEIMGSASQPTK